MRFVLLTFNRAVEKTVGFQPTIGMSFEEYLTKQVENDFYDLEENDKAYWIKSGLKHFDTFRDEKNTTYRQPNGNYCLLNDKRLEDGSVLQIISDITYLKKQEKDLRRLSEAIDTMSNGVILWSSDNNFILPSLITNNVFALSLQGTHPLNIPPDPNSVVVPEFALPLLISQ